jgi:hypothetical protein
VKAPHLTLLDAMNDANLFGSWFCNPSSWTAWRAFIAALFGLPMTDEQLTIYRQCTERTRPLSMASAEAWLICGRRAGKSFVLALIAVFLACFHDFRRYLTRGERATIMVIATDRRQARVIVRYIRGLITGTPMLASLIERETADGLDLNNAVTIEIGTASHRTTRGYTIAAALCDELAYWPAEDSATPDYEILDAVRPGMGTIPNAMLLCASSPYARRGALFDAYRRYYGRDDAPVLIWKAATRTMNPTFRQSIIDAAIERDPAAAAAEYGAEFRTDVDSYIARDVVEAAIDPGIYERPPIAGVQYSAFVDPSGGACDAMTCAVAHRENRVLTLDAIRERRPPFSPECVVAEFDALLKRYHVGTIEGDRYGGEWPREAFSRHGITYRVATRTRSDLYRDLLPELNSRNVALLDSPRLVAQLCGLERRTSRGGRDIIDHAPGSHDDIANAVAGALVMAIRRERFPVQMETGLPIFG